MTVPVDLNTWIISDPHFGHQDIGKFCNRPPHWEEKIWVNWTAQVKPGATILCLGDLEMRGNHRWAKMLLTSLTGRKLWVRGNHDKQKDQFYLDCGFEEVGKSFGRVTEYDITPGGEPYENTVENYGFYWHGPDGKRILFSHYPDVWRLDWSLNIHGHIHNNPPSPRVQEQMAEGKIYRNVSVEVIDYAPVRLRDLL